MPKTIAKLQQNIKDNYENLKILVNNELYREYKDNHVVLSQDQLDYLMCNALCYQLENKTSSRIDLPAVCMFYLNSIVDPKDAVDPQFEIIAQVVAKREKLNICNDWCKSVFMVYDLVIRQTIDKIKSDLKDISQMIAALEQMQVVAIANNSKPLLFLNGKVQSTVIEKFTEVDEAECCQWLRTLTRSIFGYR